MLSKEQINKALSSTMGFTKSGPSKFTTVELYELLKAEKEGQRRTTIVEEIARVISNRVKAETFKKLRVCPPKKNAEVIRDER